MTISFRPCNLCSEEKNIQLMYMKNDASIVKCMACGLVYVNTIPSEEEFNQIYSKDFFSRGIKFKGGKNNPSLINARDRLVRITRLPEIGTDHWVDVGCATGEFVFEAKKLVADAIGVEYSEYAAKQASSSYGISVINVDFIRNDLEKNHYDLITAWDFIEHISDPLLTFNNIFSLLKPRGYLAFSTGDIESLSAQLTGKFWHLMIPPRHLYFFSKNTITKYLRDVGFIDIRINYPSRSVPLDFIIWKFFSQLNEKLGEKLLSFLEPSNLGKLVITINLRDIMEVYARKP